MSIFAIKNRIFQSKLIQDSFWSLLGNVIGRGLALAAGIFVARFLGKEIFGEYGMIKSTILSIATFSSFGLGYTATTFVADFKNNKPEYIKLFLRYATRVTLLFSGLMAIGLLMFAPFLADDILEAPHLENALRILAGLIIFNGLNTTQIGVLAGFGKFKEIARINSLIGAVTFFLSIGLTYFFGLNGALLALLLTQIFNWFLNYKEVNLNIPKIDNQIKSDKLLIKKIFNFSTPVALQEALFSASSWISNLVLITYASYAELGMYNAAIQWFSIVLFIPGILRNVVLSHLSGTESKNKHDRIMKISIIINITMTLIPAIIVFFISGFITQFYGSSFDGLAFLIIIAIFTTVFVSVSNIYAQAYMSLGKNWLMLFIRLFRDVGKILLFLYFIKIGFFSGAESMLYSTLLFSCLSLVLMALIYLKIKKVSEI